jgi:hypothetical protein
MTTQQTLADLPPQAVLYYLGTGHYLSRAIYLAAKLGVADVLAGGPRSADDLARATETHAPSLRRVMRLLASAGVFAETADGRFELTPVGDCLRADSPGSIRAGALLFTGPMIFAAWGDLAHSVATGECAIPHVFGTDSFGYFQKHPDEGAVFDQAMAGFTAMAAVAVAAAYDLSPFRSFVDVGGGNGTLALGLLRANPALCGTVFDLPRLAESARREIAAAGMTARCEFVAGDFFEAVPSGADAYVLKHVIHDWDDAGATRILECCRRAMDLRSKLLLVESVYPERIDQSIAARGAALNDVNMLVCTGGRQRSETEFRELFRAAGFELTRIVPTMGGPCVIEGARA